jgi:hypothetical protein
MPRSPYRRLTPLQRRISDELLEQQAKEAAYADEALRLAKHYTRRYREHRRAVMQMRDFQQQLSEIVALAECEEPAA